MFRSIFNKDVMIVSISTGMHLCRLLPRFRFAALRTSCRAFLLCYACLCSAFSTSSSIGFAGSTLTCC